MISPKKELTDDVIFVASFYSKKAKRRIYAREYGKKAFKIRIKEKATKN